MCFCADGEIKKEGKLNAGGAGGGAGGHGGGQGFRGFGGWGGYGGGYPYGYYPLPYGYPPYYQDQLAIPNSDGSWSAGVDGECTSAANGMGADGIITWDKPILMHPKARADGSKEAWDKFDEDQASESELEEGVQDFANPYLNNRAEKYFKGKPIEIISANGKNLWHE